MAAQRARMRDKYREEVVPALKKQFGYGNIMQVPRLMKIVVNRGSPFRGGRPQLPFAVAGPPC